MQSRESFAKMTTKLQLSQLQNYGCFQSQAHLIPKAIKNHALEPKEFAITDDALQNVIRLYTREAGVRNLERELATLARKAVTEILKSKKKSIKVTENNLSDFLGVQRFRFGGTKAFTRRYSYYWQFITKSRVYYRNSR